MAGNQRVGSDIGNKRASQYPVHRTGCRWYIRKNSRQPYLFAHVLNINESIFLGFYGNLPLMLNLRDVFIKVDLSCQPLPYVILTYRTEGKLYASGTSCFISASRSHYCIITSTRN